MFSGAPARAYFLEGQSWTLNRTLVVQLSLGGNWQLADGFTSFDQSAADALNIWNGYLAHLRFSWVLNSPVTPSGTDELMSAAFANNVFGDKFGSGVLAITTYSFRGTTMDESDTIFNNAYNWDSYRGPVRDAQDFHRVALHEFGHALGLDHPDEHNQMVFAIMNSHISSTDTLQPDDIAGVQSLYADGPAYQSATSAPVLQNISTRGFVGTGDNVMIGGFIIQGSQPARIVLRAIGNSLQGAGIAGALEDPTITIYDSNNRVVATNDDWIDSADATTLASFHLDPPDSIESAVIATLGPGSYTAVVQSYSDAKQPAMTGIGLVEVYDLHNSGSRLGNISTRGLVQTGNSVLIGGFIVGPSQAKTVVVRALGPTLGDRGVANPLADPLLEVRDASGNLLGSNDNWQESGNATLIQSEGFAPARPSESALQLTLNPGSYTAIVQGVGRTSGVGLVEVYDLSSAPQ